MGRIYTQERHLYVLSSGRIKMPQRWSKKSKKLKILKRHARHANAGKEKHEDVSKDTKKDPTNRSGNTKPNHSENVTERRQNRINRVRDKVVTCFFSSCQQL